jgi:hypothetical protein
VFVTGGLRFVGLVSCFRVDVSGSARSCDVLSIYRGMLVRETFICYVLDGIRTMIWDAVFRAVNSFAVPVDLKNRMQSCVFYVNQSPLFAPGYSL